MTKPNGFSWIDEPLLAAMAEPMDAEEFAWLRSQGIQLIVSLTEHPPHRDWINNAGLMLLHEPVVDMTPPTQEQIDNVLENIARANEHKMAVAVHCAAGLGRTGVILACYLVSKGEAGDEAIDRIRQLRPGSIETPAQEECVREFAQRKAKGG